MVATPTSNAASEQAGEGKLVAGGAPAQATKSDGVGRLRAQAVAAMLTFHRQMMSRMTGASASEWLRLDLSSGQIKLLFWLSSAGEQPMSRVARALGIGMPAATSLVDKLVDHGVVTREHSPVDRRVVLVRASDAGHALATRLRQINEGEWRRIMEYVPDTSLPMLCEAIGVLSGAVQQANAAAGGCPHEGPGETTHLAPPDRQ